MNFIVSISGRGRGWVGTGKGFQISETFADVKYGPNFPKEGEREGRM